MSFRDRQRIGRTERRDFIKTAGVAGIVGLSGCMGDEGNGNGNGGVVNGSDPELVDIDIGISGGTYGQALEEGYIDTWNEEHDAQVTAVDRPTPEELVSMLEAGGSPPAHVIQSDGLSVYPGIQEGYWAPIRRDNLENYDNIVRLAPEDQRWEENPDDEIHHLVEDFGCNGYCWNHDELSEPDTWADTLTEETQGEIGFPTWIAFVIARNAARAGVNFNDLADDSVHEENIENIYENIQRENEAVTTWWGSGAEMEQLLTTGELSGGLLWWGRVNNLVENEGLPLSYKVPQSDADIDVDAWTDTWMIVADLDENERYTAEKFLDWTLRPENTQLRAEVTPYVATVDLPDPPEAYVNNPDMEASEEGRIETWDPVLRENRIDEWQLRFEEITRG